MKSETALPHSSSGERRRASGPTQAVPVRVWDPEGPSGGGLAPAVWDALRDSVLAVQSRWESVVEHAASPEEVAAHVAYLCAAIRQAAIGQDPDLGLVPRNALSRRLLALIRAALLERLEALSPVPETAQVLRLLAAVECITQRLEVDWSQRFTDRLGG
ncbi:MAG TPA: hypothetical protein VGQ69_10395, partial [Gemmatimonadales bacterium]|nr:hypothetical protein [Gemmatimonadales bacterium]